MNKNYFINKFLITSIVFVIIMGTFSCQKDELFEVNNTEKVSDQSPVNSFKAAGVLSENFENGSKGSYAAANVSLSTGTWNLNDALLGTTSSDRKYGSKSVRVRNTGTATMKFDNSNGASVVSVYHAKYGTNGSSTWALYKSTNSGSSWAKVGSTITTSSTSLTKQSFTVNQSGNVRFEIRKLSGGSNRINFDNFEITDYSSGSGGGSTTPTRDNNMGMGNPSGATTSTSNSNNYLMVKPQYTMSYNNSKKTCNWVSWHLSEAWMGSAARQNNFRTDYDLPSSWTKVGSNDYKYSGFNKGHMCPSADRNGSTTDNSATFLMTNMVPQSPNNNQRTWGDLEDYCRDLANDGNELYIISGVYGQGGTGSNGYATSISSKNIMVPSYVWKVIVVLPNGSNDVSRVSTSTRVIAVWMPNNQVVSNYDWEHYKKSVDYVESKTGYNFLSNVSTSIQNVIEARVD